VRVLGKEQRRERRITVTNIGIPIQPQHIERIFDKFFRSPEAQQHVREGAGIGLYLVRKFADTYHGRISVSSDPVSGGYGYLTAFTLTVPRDLR
jgi:signal transduction histidine kinase